MIGMDVLRENAPEDLAALSAEVNEALRGFRPPGLKAMEAVQLIEVEHKTTRQAAERLKLSQTRVRQLVDQVRGYLARISPQVKDEATVNQQLYVSEGLGLERLKYLYRRAMQSYRRSCGPRTVVRVVPSLLGNRETETTTDSCGDIRYLQMAMRISEAMAKTPDNGLLNRAFMAALEWEEKEGRGEDREAEVVEAEAVKADVVKAEVAKSTAPKARPKSPPVGACSKVAAMTPLPASKKPPEIDLSCGGKYVYGEQADATYRALDAMLTPAQRAELEELARPDAEVGAEVGAGDGVEGKSAAKPAADKPWVPLNRKERRARQRQLEKVRRKAR